MSSRFKRQNSSLLSNPENNCEPIFFYSITSNTYPREPNKREKHLKSSLLLLIRERAEYICELDCTMCEEKPWLCSILFPQHLSLRKTGMSRDKTNAMKANSWCPLPHLFSFPTQGKVIRHCVWVGEETQYIGGGELCCRWFSSVLIWHAYQKR